MRSNILETKNGAPCAWTISITCPKPPRNSPSPPEPARYSRRLKTSGAVTSFTSVGVVRTPDGNAVVDSPSLATRAPVPPLKIGLMTNGAAETLPLCAPAAPAERSTGFQMQEAPSAGTTPGSAWSRQPSTTSGNIWPKAWRADTAAGNSALRMHPAGALTVTGASEPALFGTSLPTTQRTPNDAYASV